MYCVHIMNSLVYVLLSIVVIMVHTGAKVV